MDPESAPSPLPVSTPVAATVERKHSGLGISSFVISLAGGFAMFLLFCVAGFMETTTPGGIDETSGVAVVLGLVIFAVIAVHLLGLGLAIGALTQKNRKKVFSILGLIFNAVVVVGTTALIFIGNAME
jgi:hypothetical protein